MKIGKLVSHIISSIYKIMGDRASIDLDLDTSWDKYTYTIVVELGEGITANEAYNILNRVKTLEMETEDTEVEVAKASYNMLENILHIEMKVVEHA